MPVPCNEKENVILFECCFFSSCFLSSIDKWEVLVRVVKEREWEKSSCCVLKVPKCQKGD